MRGRIVVIVALASLAGVAHADPAEDAKAVAAQAKQAATDGVAAGNDPAKLEEAIALYKQAYAIDPNPVYQCNAGVAYQLLDQLPRAHNLLSQCLARLPAVQPKAVALFRPRLDEIEQLLPSRAVAIDVVSEPPGARVTVSTFSEDEPIAAPGVVWLLEGTHTFRATLAGHVAAEHTLTIDEATITDQHKLRVRFELAEEVRAPEVRDRVIVEPAAPSSGKRTAGWIALISGGVALAAGGAMHAVTLRTRGDLAELDGDAYDAKLPTFQTQRAVTLALYGVGAAAAITGAVLLYLSSHDERVAVTPAEGGGAMVWVDLTP